MACERITRGITRRHIGENPVKAVLDPYNPTGSTAFVNFNTSKTGPLGDRRRASATSTGSSSTATGKPSSAASPRHTRRSCPTSRTTTSASRSPTATAPSPASYRPDFIVLVDDGHEPKDGDAEPAAPRRRDQGLPARGRQGEGRHDARLLGPRREQPWHVRPLGLRRVRRCLRDAGGLRGEGRNVFQPDDRRSRSRTPEEITRDHETDLVHQLTDSSRPTPRRPRGASSSRRGSPATSSTSLGYAKWDQLELKSSQGKNGRLRGLLARTRCDDHFAYRESVGKTVDLGSGSQP